MCQRWLIHANIFHTEFGPKDEEVILDEEQAFGQLATDEQCQRGNCQDMPPTMRLKIRAAYGSAFLQETKNDKTTPVERIKRAFCHAQARFCHSSTLGTKIQVGSSACSTARSMCLLTAAYAKEDSALNKILPFIPSCRSCPRSSSTTRGSGRR